MGEQHTHWLKAITTQVVESVRQDLFCISTDMTAVGSCVTPITSRLASVDTAADSTSHLNAARKCGVHVLCVRCACVECEGSEMVYGRDYKIGTD